MIFLNYSLRALRLRGKKRERGREGEGERKKKHVWVRMKEGKVEKSVLEK